MMQDGPWERYYDELDPDDDGRCIECGRRSLKAFCEDCYWTRVRQMEADVQDSRDLPRKDPKR